MNRVTSKDGTPIAYDRQGSGPAVILVTEVFLCRRAGATLPSMDDEQGRTKPSEQRGGTTPDEKEAREKGEWAGTAGEGVVPAELGGSDAPREMLPDDPELDSSVVGRTTGSDEPATEAGVDRSAGDDADATTDGGTDLPEKGEPDLKDIGVAPRRGDAESAD